MSRVRKVSLDKVKNGFSGPDLHQLEKADSFRSVSDPDFFQPGSRIQGQKDFGVQEGTGSRIRILIFYFYSLGEDTDSLPFYTQRSIMMTNIIRRMRTEIEDTGRTPGTVRYRYTQRHRYYRVTADREN